MIDWLITLCLCDSISIFSVSNYKEKEEKNKQSSYLNWRKEEKEQQVGNCEGKKEIK